MKHVEVDDADVDSFIAEYLPRTKQEWSPEKRADAMYELAIMMTDLLDQEPTRAWIEARAKRVRERVLWMGR